MVRSRLIVGRLWSCFEPELLSSPKSPPLQPSPLNNARSAKNEVLVGIAKLGLSLYFLTTEMCRIHDVGLYSTEKKRKRAHV